MAERVPLSWPEATRQVADKLRGLKGAGRTIAAIGTARATTEELFLFHKLAREVLGAGLVDCVPHQGDGDKFLLSADRTPNTNGAKLTGVTAEPVGGRIPMIAEAIKSGKVKTLIVHGENIVKHGIVEELLRKLDLLVAIDTLPNALTDLAHYILPGATFAEKRGTFINVKGRLQRLNAAIPSPGLARPEWQTFTALLNELGADGSYLAIEDVFADMARTLVPLAGLNLSRIGDLGVELNLAAGPKAVPAGQPPAPAGASV